MTDYKHILYEKQGAFGRVRLNRPKYLNAQSQLMLDEMDMAFQEAVADDDVRVIILSGEGDNFSSGHDLGTPEEIEHREKTGYKPNAAGMFTRMEKIYVEYGLRWRDLPKPTMAMIHGFCIYGGWQIASSMDIIVAAEDTKLLPGFIEYFSLPWDLGIRKTKELLFRNQFISAEQACELGFVSHVVPKDELEKFTCAIADEIAQNNPWLTKMAKLSTNQAQDAMGFRMAVQTALSNFIVMASAAGLSRGESDGQTKRSLSTVDQAMAKTIKDEQSDQEK